MNGGRAVSANVELVRAHYAATNERDFPRAMWHYAEDVELVVPSGTYVNAGTFSGRDEVGRWFGDWFATFDRDARFDIRELIDIDEASVLLIARHHARGRTSRVAVEADVIWLYELREDKIKRVRAFQTRPEAFQAVGLEE
jgi:ketosteroid isomerase-like protein